jgi:hypothetical protein
VTTDTTTAAVTALRAIREQWGDLCAAIDQPPAAEWPPRDSRALGVVAEPEPTEGVGRLPLTLREHPAPLNLGALDAAMEIEWALFDLADRIASVVQHSIRHVPVPNVGARGRVIADPADINDADRWYYVTPTTPGSRAFGLHWAAVWIERRLTATAATPLHGRLDSLIAESMADDIEAAHRVMQRALGRDGRVTVLPAPCPWCGGELTARTHSGDPMAAVVTCGTGPTCTAPAPYDGEARRVWRGADLCGLYGALSAAERRATA